jgi:hypothetical protein
MGKNEFIKHRIGEEYLHRTQGIEENTEFIKDAFIEINRINRELFDLIPYQVRFTSRDIYKSAAHMRERVQRDGFIYIYDGWGGHPFLTQEENNIGRAVHDVWSHLVCGCPFSFEGELTAYYEQRKHYPEWTWDVLFAEIVGQTCAYYSNNQSHDFNQRAIAAPSKWRLLADVCILPDFSHNSILKPYNDVIFV